MTLLYNYCVALPFEGYNVYKTKQYNINQYNFMFDFTKLLEIVQYSHWYHHACITKCAYYKVSLHNYIPYILNNICSSFYL